MTKRKNYDAVMSKKIPDDKLSITQLKSLLNFKKRKNDPKFSHMKKDQLKNLWLEWKHRSDTPPTSETRLSTSVSFCSGTTDNAAATKLASMCEVEEV